MLKEPALMSPISYSCGESASIRVERSVLLDNAELCYDNDLPNTSPGLRGRQTGLEDLP
jgi:hypothetical protein